MAGFDNEVVYGSNVDFSGSAIPAATMLTNAQLLIGSTALNVGGTHINVGTLTSPGGTVTIGYSTPNITLDITGGAVAMQKIAVDASTPPGTNPVVPTAAGIITITGAQVATGTVGTNVIRTDSLAANTLTIEVQRSTTASTPTLASNGVSHYNALNFDVDANAYVSAKNGLQAGPSNLGITNTAGTTFTVNGSDGTALSSSNPAFVTLQSLANPGRLKTYKITANQSCTQTDIGASTFGLTNGVAHSTDFPMFLYAVSNANNGENTIAFMISRYPNTKVSPVAGKIGKAGSIVCNSQGSFFSLANVTVADYASSPCLCLGSFRCTRSAGNAVTFTTFDIGDGIGCFQQERKFIIPTAGGQYGAATGSLFYANGGTAPIFADYANGYYVSQNDALYIATAFANCTSAGVGSVNLQLASPYSLDGSTNGSCIVATTTATLLITPTVQPNGPDNQIAFAATGGASNFVINSGVQIDANFKFSTFVNGPIFFS